MAGTRKISLLSPNKRPENFGTGLSFIRCFERKGTLYWIGLFSQKMGGDSMARANLRLQRITGHRVFRTVRQGSMYSLARRANRRMRILYIVELKNGSVPHVQVFVSRLKEAIIAEVIDALDMAIRVRPAPCKRYWRGGHGMELNRRCEEKSFPGTRLLCYLQKILKNRLFGEKYAAWHREGPPNDLVFC